MDNERRKNLNLRRLNDTRLDSELRRKSFLLIEQLENAGLKPLVTQGFRSIEEQNRLYSIGRTKKGKIVTNAKGGQSKHNFGKAVDFAFVDSSGNITWDADNFKKLGRFADKIGLIWGGHWKRFTDMPHIEV